MDTFEIKNSKEESSNIRAIDTSVGRAIFETCLKMDVKQEFDVLLTTLKVFPYPYSTIEEILNEVRNTINRGFNIVRKNEEERHIGYTIRRFR